MKKSFFLVLIIQVMFLAAIAQPSVVSLLTENRVNPVGIDVLQPRFSWVIQSDKRNVVQTAYEIRVLSGKQIVWNSGKVTSDQSVHVPYNGSPLQSGEKYSWQVRVWDNSNQGSKWSQVASFQMGLLNPEDWKAGWIEPGYTEDHAMRPSPLMRKPFILSKRIASASVYITAHGLYEAYINGQRVGDAFLTPGWTAYKKRLQYQMYDVTSLLNSGSNVIGVMLGNGWYRGIIGYANNINVYGSDIALLCQLDITYTDGTKESIVTDNTWKSSTGAIKYSEIYNGEIRDARLEKAGWNNTGFNDNEWQSVKVADHPKDILIATWNEPIRKQETFQSCKDI